jgi:hypothetical protein
MKNHGPLIAVLLIQIIQVEYYRYQSKKMYDQMEKERKDILLIIKKKN